MSLTSEIDARTSPLSAFLAAELPDVAGLRAAYRAARPPGDVVSPVAPPGLRVQHGTLGAAVDHRLRYALTDEVSPGGAVTAGVMFAPDLYRDPAVGEAVQEAGRELYNALGQVLDEHRPADRSRPMRLPPAGEDRLCRLCYAAAWYEETFRAGRIWPGTPLGDAGRDFTLDRLLVAVPAYATDDLAAMVDLAERGALGELRAATTPDRAHAAPTFAGSTDVGGADADLIAAGLLLDVKATTRPYDTKGIGRPQLYQLAGYLLLDYDDAHAIQRVGLYLARLGWLVSWDVLEFLQLLGARRPLTALRESCARILGSRQEPGSRGPRVGRPPRP